MWDEEGGGVERKEEEEEEHKEDGANTSIVYGVLGAPGNHLRDDKTLNIQILEKSCLNESSIEFDV